MSIDTIKELHRIAGELADLVAREQDDTTNGLLCDAYDNVCAATRRLNEKAHEEFQSDTQPNGTPVPMR